MVEVTYENVAPVVGLILIGVTAYGAARKFTEMDKDIRNDQEKSQHDISILEESVNRLQAQIDGLRHHVNEMHTILTRLKQQMDDRLTKN
jgi:uncharacterized protein YlxW (UPF0749 family)